MLPYKPFLLHVFLGFAPHAAAHRPAGVRSLRCYHLFVREGTHGGFVLAGGESSRLGRDKAFLRLGAATLIEHVAAEVKSAAGSAVILGSPERYGHLGYPCVADFHAGRGPLGGMETALTMTDAAWNLVVACDMPAVTAAFLAGLLKAAEASDGDCLVPVSPDGRMQPLCAVYHRDCLPRLREALAEGRYTVREAIRGPRAVLYPVSDAAWFRNINSTADLAVQEPLRSKPA